MTLPHVRDDCVFGIKTSIPPAQHIQLRAYSHNPFLIRVQIPHAVAQKVRLLNHGTLALRLDLVGARD